MEGIIRKPVDFNDRELSFCIREWYSDDREDQEDQEDPYPEKLYRIYLFGVTKEGYSVCLEVNDFEPYFYVKVPGHWTESECRGLVQKIKKALWKRSKHLVGHKLVKRKDAYGFNNQKEFKFLRLIFNNKRVCTSVQYMLKKPIEGHETMRFSIYDSNIDPMLVFMHVSNITASGWVKVSSKKLTENTLSRCQYNYSCHWKDVNPMDESSIPPLVTLSFDLECYSSDGSFPNPDRLDNRIIQIGSSIQRFGEDKIYKHIIVLGSCDSVPGATLVVVKTEKELIEEWIRLLQRVDPDQLIGYNIDDFDWTFLWKRAEKQECIDSIINGIGRLDHQQATFNEDKLESNAYGANSFNYIVTVGVGQIDLLHWFRKNTKLDQYNLDFVSHKFLGENKRPVTPQEIFSMGGPNGDAKSRSVVADYCVQDTALPLRLMDNRCMMPNLIEMSRVTYTPFTWLIMRGEQIKVYSQLSRELRKRKFVLPGKIIQQASEFEGATVLDAEKGAYFEPVSGLDFASLYPSIMIAHNLCPTTWVRLPKYQGIEGVEYKQFRWGINDHWFVQNKEGIVPGILSRLWEERKKVKRKMAAEKDTRLKAILNGKQLAIKVSMNSIYGFFGVKSGIFPCQPISSTVTYIGRTMIEHSKKCAEKWYDGSERCGGVKAHVIYGDSVTGDTPVTLNIRGGKFIVAKRIDSIHTSTWRPYNEFKSDDLVSNRQQKQQAECNNALIWTSSGWKKIKRVIRHKVKKRLYRIVTEKGIVVCTEDHSLLRKNGEKVKPKDVSIGEELMHRFIQKNNDTIV